MKILYVGCFVDPSSDEEIRKITNGGYVFSATTFQLAFLKGFTKDGLHPDYIVNVPAIGSFPNRCKKLFIKGSCFEYNGIKGINCPFCNLSFFKRFSINSHIYKEVKRWVASYKNERIVILLYSLLPEYLIAVAKIKNEFNNVNICCIVLDLPEYFNAPSSFAYRLLAKYETKSSYSHTNQIDYFVLLTKQMADRLNVGKRPWLLMEGIYDPSVSNDSLISKEFAFSKKSLLYTGYLDVRYGIKKLLDAISLIDDRDVQLYICGDGPDRSVVEEAANKDSRIHYLGVKTHEEVLNYQREVTLLINPREGVEEFTKYSFPSKTMEYLASGTPTLMYHLPCIPEEYDDYIVYFADNSLKTMTDTIICWLNKPENDRIEFGRKASDFILNNKNARAQISRFEEFLSHVESI